jgi:CheY-like chemotaxis protein
MMDRALLKSVMYVDDEPDIRDLIEMALDGKCDFTISTCGSGPEALALLPVTNPDFVLLDVMMPGMDGPTTFSHMRANPALASVPVAFMTAKALPDEVARFRALGAVGVIAKPFNPVRLAQQIIALWEKLPHA